MSEEVPGCFMFGSCFSIVSCGCVLKRHLVVRVSVSLCPRSPFLSNVMQPKLFHSCAVYNTPIPNFVNVFGFSYCLDKFKNFTEVLPL
jgi:hypothetical protein